jgi:hypothetical protein
MSNVILAISSWTNICYFRCVPKYNNVWMTYVEATCCTVAIRADMYGIPILNIIFYDGEYYLPGNIWDTVFTYVRGKMRFAQNTWDDNNSDVQDHREAYKRPTPMSSAAYNGRIYFPNVVDNPINLICYIFDRILKFAAPKNPRNNKEWMNIKQSLSIEKRDKNFKLILA